MLQLTNITKTYESGIEKVEALKGVNLEFRKSEFVSILGQSGCGKTTLLNIIGGLDRYTDGDLIINGKSTKTFKDSDWDTYRNHSIGFVFQSYNLIPHQTVLANVELALTLSGVSKTERRQRAISALESVGLSDQINKKPTQMSGGQMQRVAIARALVNNPDILLADEPTGALDTKTSVQIMDILKEVSKNRLVIMVTHNPDIAEEYSTRIVRLSDGLVVSDSNPYDSSAEATEQTAEISAPVETCAKKAKKKKAEKKPRMSFFTALSLSMNNLFTKKGRTVMTSFAGSIGIIGIALILSLSNGIQLFINQVQEDTLSTYPLSIQKETQDMSAMMSAMMQVSEAQKADRDPNMIYIDDSLDKMMEAMTSTIKNDLVSFKKYLEKHDEEISKYVSDIQYTYALNMYVYNAVQIKNNAGGTSTEYRKIGLQEMLKNMPGFESMGEMAASSGMMNVMSEMIDNQQLLDQQYDVIAGDWPKNANEVVLVVSKNNQISKMTLYMLGVLDPDDLKNIDFTNYEPIGTDKTSYTFDELMNIEFVLVNAPDIYVKQGNYWVEDPAFASGNLESFFDANSEDVVNLKISGIIRPREDASASSISGAIGYTKGLTDMLLEKNNNSEIVIEQRNNPNVNVFNGASFERIPYTRKNINDLVDRVGSTNMNSFYSIMTSYILQTDGYKEMLKIDDSSVAMFLTTMSDKQQAEKIGDLLKAANENNPMGVSLVLKMLQMVPGGLTNVDFTVDNVVSLLPLMSEQQIMMLVGIPGKPATDTTPEVQAIIGLKDLCSAEYKAEFFAAMSKEMENWSINEKSLSLLLGMMDDKMFVEFEEMLYNMVPDKDATYESNIELLGAARESDPQSINFYAKDFDSKEKIEEFIKNYNSNLPQNESDKKIEYTDIIGTMMSSISTIIDVISYVLIAFVAISLVVSSIMIGIITNISVLERTKEIGILRAIGASKKDVSRVFNAETFIIGTCAGILGILITVLLCIPANAIIQALTGFSNIKATLPVVAAFILIAISMGLTLIAGLIPSRAAAKKDPVEALRSE